MENMHIVGWSDDYRETEQAKVFEEKEQVLEFVARMSPKQYFMIHRVNQYKRGKLVPHKLELINGKLSLSEEEIKQ